MTRVLVASDRPAFAEGLALALTAQPELDVATAPWRRPSLRPGDTLVLAVVGSDAKRVAARVRRESDGVKIVLVDDPQDLSVSDDFLDFDAYVSSSASVSTLVEVIRQVANGRTEALDSGGALRPYPDQQLVDRLSPREREVLELLADESVDATARALDISPNTLRTHVRNACGKLGVRSREQAIALVVTAVRAASPPMALSYEVPSVASANTQQVFVVAVGGMRLDSLLAVLQGQAGIGRLGVHHDAASARTALVSAPPDVALIDPAIAGWASLCREMTRSGVPVGLLAVEPASTVLREAAEAGATGCVSLAQPVAQVVDALHAIAAGHAHFPPSALGNLLRDLVRRRSDEDAIVRRFLSLSAREQEVLALLGDGSTETEIAETLFVSQNTARTHIQNVLRKLEVSSRASAVQLTADLRLLERFSSTCGERE